MIKKRLFLAVMLLTAFVTGGWACTNFIVGKNASADGSVLVSYSADSYGLFGFLCHYPAAVHPAGAMRNIYEWDTGKYLGQIKEARQTYNVIGNMNEFQVTIGETTFGGRPELVDSTGIMDYGSLIYVALQRSRTAKEAIKVMTDLVKEYGYYSSGESFSIADPNEAWIMEMIGKGPGVRGAVWVAVRIPDDCIAAHANQSRIHKFDMSDKENCLYSPDVISFAREKGYFSGKNTDFSFADAYCPLTFDNVRFCEARVWSFYNMFSKATGEAYLSHILGESKEPMPLYVKPDKKISVRDIQHAMRDHYEGTPLDITKDCGAGAFNMPYRLSPLSFKVDGKEYFNERPISTQQSGFSYIAQLRSWLPRQVGGILWFGNDDGNMVAYTPVYCGNTVQPECYNTPGADAVTFSDKNAYWVCNWVSNMVYPRYSMMFGSLKEVRDSLEAGYDAEQGRIEAEACKLDEGRMIDYLNDYSNAKAEQMLARWKQLAVYLIVKYNDMVIKPEDGNGAFKRTATGLGARVERPGFPEKAARDVVRATGDKYAVPAVEE